jgi:hypothetical protein
MKTEYNIKDKVWIHIGAPGLTEGRVVEIITLDHLKENHRPGHELYVIEIKTGIEDVYEVREFEATSPDAAGPIMCYRNLEVMMNADRYLRQVGVTLPHVSNTSNPIDFPEEDFTGDPTADQIHAALARAEKGHTTIYKPTEKPAAKKAQKRRPFVKRKKNESPNAG